MEKKAVCLWCSKQLTQLILKIMEAIFSKRGDNIKVVGQFYVTYSAQRNGKQYTTVHLSASETKIPISADELNVKWQERFKGLCPFNGDINFEIVRIQQRMQ